VCKLSLCVSCNLLFQKFPVWQQSWCLAMVRRSFCLSPHLQLNTGLRMTARKFLMYELSISYLGKHHEGVMIFCMKDCAIMLHHMELFAGGWRLLLVGGEEVRDTACSGAPASVTDEGCGACWCCAWGRQQHNLNSNCNWHGNIHSKHVLYSLETAREEEGLCKVDSIRTEWRPANHMCYVC